VRSKLLTAALEEAYANQMMSGRFPSCVLQVELPREAVDVNVHPAKIEVKFANERAVFDCVRYGVLGCLSKTQARPQMQLKMPQQATPAPSAPVTKPVPAQQTAAPKPQPRQDAFRTMTTQEFKTFAQVLSQPVSVPAAKPVKEALSAPAFGVREQAAPQPEPPKPPEEKKAPTPVPAPPAPAEPQPEPVQESLTMKKTPAYRVVGEVLNTYIIIEQEDSVLFLDKHAAHERILFEQLKKTDQPVMAQSLIASAAVQLTAEEAAAVLEHRELLLQCGFDAEDFGTGVILRQIPADLDLSHAEDALQEIAQRLLTGRDPKALRDDLLHTVACKAAIKAGWHTTEKERDSLVKQVLERDDIKYCPHGRPVITTLTRGQLERQFKR